MSRTIRRKNGKIPSWLYNNKEGRNVFSHYCRYRKRNKHYNYREKWEYRTDNWKDRWWTGPLKEYTSFHRRADERMMLLNVVKHDDFDYKIHDMEKKYLGYLWNFD